MRPQAVCGVDLYSRCSPGAANHPVCPGSILCPRKPLSPIKLGWVVTLVLGDHLSPLLEVSQASDPLRGIPGSEDAYCSCNMASQTKPGSPAGTEPRHWEKSLEEMGATSDSPGGRVSVFKAGTCLGVYKDKCDSIWPSP